jgi:hypothetical protein
MNIDESCWLLMFELEALEELAFNVEDEVDALKEIEVVENTIEPIFKVDLKKLFSAKLILRIPPPFLKRRISSRILRIRSRI